jgi:hypothetical protein
MLKLCEKLANQMQGEIIYFGSWCSKLSAHGWLDPLLWASSDGVGGGKNKERESKRMRPAFSNKSQLLTAHSTMNSSWINPLMNIVPL